MLVQSQCFLTRLHLIDVVLNDNLGNIIWHVPGLQEFFIIFHKWVNEYDPIMKSLVTQLHVGNLVDGSLQHSMVPSLQELSIYLFSVQYTHISFIDSAFVSMVASLKVVVMGVGWTYDLDGEGKNTLNSLENEGLKLHLNTEYGHNRF
ncbi:hypothetical protein IW262DRAFT_1299413 [Armillaria fumosa]|nr:hypothetical protein IW262DRAFT_1299413 [Armillaria fumosa]